MGSDTIKKIEKIKQKITNLEDSYALESQNVADLRRMVMYTHTTIEMELLNSEIGQYLIDKVKNRGMTPREQHYFYLDLLAILDEMDFIRKVKVAQKYQLFPKGLVKNVLAVNQLRVYCSHPTSYLDKLETFREEESYLDALMQLEDALDSVLAS